MEIKDLLYQTISEYGEKRILSDIAQGESHTTISTIFEYCMSNLEKAGVSNPEIRGDLAEGLIHYLLTVALIPSQRKTVLQSIDIDVTVPDTKTLASSPEDVIVISFPKTKEPSVIKEHVNKLKKIQPKSENIWMVIDEPVSVEAKLYTLDRNGFTFSNIVNDLISFTSNAKQSKLKIFRI
ncbi:MAG: hypothetical protein ACREA3_08310 [Nitrosotalea sp.]